MKAGVRLQAPESGPDATASPRERDRVGFRSGDIVFGRYRLECPLDRRGRVWLVLSNERRPFALKLGERGALEREQDVLAECAHPHVVAAVACHAQDATAGLVLEYLAGGDVVSLAGSDPRCWLGPVAELIDALECVHARGFVHRDVKARNVRLDRNDRARLIDFGSAVRAGSPWSRGGTTAEAIRPDRGASPIVPADDAYSLAALLHELLYGGPPGSGHGPRHGVRGHGRHEHEPLERLVAAGLGLPAGQAPTIRDFADSLKSLQ